MGRDNDSEDFQLQNDFLDGLINLDLPPIVNILPVSAIPSPVAMPQDESQITLEDMADPNQPQNPNAPNAPMTNEINQQLATALNQMCQEFVTFRIEQTQAADGNNENKDDDANNRDQSQDDDVHPNPNGYYPDLDKVCRYLYLDLTDMMDTANAKEWLRSLETLVRIMRCSWILNDPPIRPAGVTVGEAQKIRLAIMANFQLRIPSDIKVVLSVDVDDPVVSPSKTFSTLTAHFSRLDPFFHDKLRTQTDNRTMGRSERVNNYIKWHRELRAKMLEAKFQGVEEESLSIKWIVRGIASHHHYGQLACAWRAEGPPTTISEIEAIMTNEEA